jgi:phage repressor protein C with HTH and peptisase S24 domain
VGPLPADSAAAPSPRRVLLPLQWVRVAGPSMVPTLRPGDGVLVRRGGRPRPGDVVLARFDDLPGQWVVKRLREWTADGRGILASDNPGAGGDSRTHGPGEVHGRALVVRHGRRFGRPAAAPDL